MTSMWNAPYRSRWRHARAADAQARFLTPASLRWVLKNKAYTPWYLVRYFRLARFRLANPHVVLRGMVFLGKDVEIHATPEMSRMEIGRWVHIGDGNSIRCHEGSLRIGDKAVFGCNNVVNAYIDIEFGGSSLIADWCYICDFDHVTDDINTPIKDQGIVKSPVRIGPDCWLGAKVTVTRGTFVGSGCVMAANAVVRGTVPAGSVVGGVPARVLKDRRAAYEADAARRAALADIARKTRVAAQENAQD